MSKFPAVIRDTSDAFDPRASLDVVLASENIEQTVADVIRQFEERLEKLECVAAQCRQKFLELVNEALAQVPPNGRI